jgi:hypothetical protein
VTKPRLYAQFGIPHYWRIELAPPTVTTDEIRQGDRYHVGDTRQRLVATEPFEIDLDIAELVPSWAKQ